MWYLSAALKPVGPYTLNELQDKMKRGALGPSELVFNEEAQEWKMAAHWTELHRLGFPAFEAPEPLDARDPAWVLLRQKSGEKDFVQEGPFTTPAVLQMLTRGECRGEDLVWKKGLSGWSRVMDRLEFNPPAETAGEGAANELDL